MACDFFSVDSVWLTRYYVLFFVEIESRRVQVCGITTNPTGPWVTQHARNLAASFEEAGRVVRHLIRDRDARCAICASPAPTSCEPLGRGCDLWVK